MGAFTVTLKRAIELSGGTTEWVPGENGAQGYTKFTPGSSTLGLMDYPIWDPAYRDRLNGKIIDQYWNREIGQETIDLFQLAVRRKLDQSMPLINQMYQTTQLEFDPLSTINLTTLNSADSTQTTNNTSSNQTTSDSSGKSRTVQSETPQMQLAGNEDYATGLADANSQSAANSSANEDSSQDITANANGQTTVKGYQAMPSDLIMQYRATLLNIDMLVINELADLFMLVWDTGDAYTQSSNLIPYPYPFGRIYW